MRIAVGLTVTLTLATSRQLHRALGRIADGDLDARVRLAAAALALPGLAAQAPDSSFVRPSKNSRSRRSHTVQNGSPAALMRQRNIGR